MKKTLQVLALFLAVACTFIIFQNFDSLTTRLYNIREGKTTSPVTSLYCNSQNFEFEMLNCAMNFLQYRNRDARVIELQIANQNFNLATSQTPSRIFQVKTAQEFNNLSGKLYAGDHIILEDQIWNNAILNFHGLGLIDKPIVIRSRTNHGALFKGTSQLNISGRHIIVHGLSFIDNIATNEVISQINIGIKGDPTKVCNFCVLNFTKIYNFNFPTEVFSARVDKYKSDYIAFQEGRLKVEPAINFNSHFVTVYGEGITISRSDFRSHNGRGNMIQASAVLPLAVPNQLHLIRNYFAKRPHIIQEDWPDTIKNGYEILLLGMSSHLGRPSFALIENNLIQEADGEIEIMTIKTSDVIIRQNTFRDNIGSLTLRKADRVLVEGNFFISGNRPNNYGGLRVIGGGHWIVNNQFINVGNSISEYTYAALSVNSANFETAAESAGAYHRVQNVMVSNNSFYGCKLCVFIGNGYNDSDMNLYPIKVAFVANLFSGQQENNNRYFRFATTLTRNTQNFLDMLSSFKFHSNLFIGNMPTGLESIPIQTSIVREHKESLVPTLQNGRVLLSDQSLGINNGVSLSSYKRFYDIDNFSNLDERFDIGADEKGNENSLPQIPAYFSTINN